MRSAMGRVLRWCADAWHLVRRLSGDDAYERYLRHCSLHHANEPTLSRAEFFRRWQDGKWQGVKRCC